MESSRRDFLKSLATISLPILAGCSTLENATETTKVHEFRQALGKQWNHLPRERKKQTVYAWKNSFNEYDRNNLLTIYSKPENHYNTLTDKRKCEVYKMESALGEIPNKNSQEYEDFLELTDNFPWINPKDATKSDALLLEKISNSLSSAFFY